MQMGIFWDQESPPNKTNAKHNKRKPNTKQLFYFRLTERPPPFYTPPPTGLPTPARGTEATPMNFRVKCHWSGIEAIPKSSRNQMLRGAGDSLTWKHQSYQISISCFDRSEIHIKVVEDWFTGICITFRCLPSHILIKQWGAQHFQKKTTTKNTKRTTIQYVDFQNKKRWFPYLQRTICFKNMPMCFLIASWRFLVYLNQSIRVPRGSKI